MLIKRNFSYVGIIALLLLSFQFTPMRKAGDEEFKRSQLSNIRVLNAYQEKIDSIDNWLLEKNLAMNDYQVLIRAFKKEDLMEVWVKNYNVDTFALLKTYKICMSSGFLGPKRRQGDRQIPEGSYVINEFNPVSNYHLSLGINYPNKSDSILGERGNLGGDIYIHGGCASIGCMPITTLRIKELYIITMQARYFGQRRIPVHVFPCKLTESNYKVISQSFNNPELSKFWGSLRFLYVYFEKYHTLPITYIDNNGKYHFYPK